MNDVATAPCPTCEGTGQCPKGIDSNVTRGFRKGQQFADANGGDPTPDELVEFLLRGAGEEKASDPEFLREASTTLRTLALRQNGCADAFDRRASAIENASASGRGSA